MLGSFQPEDLQIDFYFRKGLDPDPIVVRVEPRHNPLTGFQPKPIERLNNGGVRNAVTGVNAHPVVFVNLRGAGGEDLASPIRSDRDPVVLLRRWKAIHFSAGRLRYDKIFSKEDLWLDDKPSTGSAIINAD